MAGHVNHPKVLWLHANRVLAAVPLLAALLAAPPVVSDEVAVSFVKVGDPGNPQDATGLGAVDHSYRIGMYEVTNGQYAAFLNAVAASDPHGLYNEDMKITRSGDPGSYTYSTADGDKPVTSVSFYDALRFANWLHNGQPQGAQDPTPTEDGAYTFTGLTEVGSRNPGAKVFLPSESEWYKAAYYKGGSTGEYWTYPTGSDDEPTAEFPGVESNLANFDNVLGDVTEVGAYSGSPGPYGTFDQAGNVWEWNEAMIDSERGLRGGSWDDYNLLLESWYRDSDDPNLERKFIGFRVAAAIIDVPFRRGFVDEGGESNVTDVINMLGYMFLSSFQPTCLSALDTTDDGKLDVTDAIALLKVLFLDSSAVLADPYLNCSLDPTPDDLSCEAHSPCAGGP